jgi:hypothetical protein
MFSFAIITIFRLLAEFPEGSSQQSVNWGFRFIWLAHESIRHFMTPGRESDDASRKIKTYRDGNRPFIEEHDIERVLILCSAERERVGSNIPAQ